MKVEINDELVKVFKKRVDSTDEFSTVEKYVDNILNQVAERLKEENNVEINKKDEEKIKERLKSLGYLD